MGYSQSIKSEYAPVVLFTYNRLDVTVETLRRLSENILSTDTDVFIFSDGYKGDNDKDKVLSVREYLAKFKEDNVFHHVEVREASTNKGLAKSIIDGVSEIISIYGRVIVLEDDLYTTEDFLQYMNGALDYYSNDEKVWSIAGYGYDLKSLENYPSDVYLSYRGSSWGWATWKDRWDSVDWAVSSYGSRRYYLKEKVKFARGGNDLPSMLKAQMNGKIDSWAVRWCFSQSLQDKYTVYPKNSKIENHGFGTGTHSLESDGERYSISKLDESQPCEFSDLEVNQKIVKDFKRIHDISLWDRVVGKIRMEIKYCKNFR